MTEMGKIPCLKEETSTNERFLPSCLYTSHTLSFPHEKTKLGINNLKETKRIKKSTYNKSVLNNVSSTKSYRNGVTHTCGMPRLYIWDMRKK